MHSSTHASNRSQLHHPAHDGPAQIRKTHLLFPILLPSCIRLYTTTRREARPFTHSVDLHESLRTQQTAIARPPDRPTATPRHDRWRSHPVKQSTQQPQGAKAAERITATRAGVMRGL